MHRLPVPPGLGSDLASRWAEILTEHLATTPRATSEDSWAYKQRLVEVFDFPSFWASCPGVIRVYINRKPSLTSLEEVKKIPSLTTMTSPSTLSLLPPLSQETSPKIAIIPESLADTPVLTEGDLDRLSSAHRSDIFRNRSATNVRWCVGPLLAVDWRTPPEAETLYTPFPERPVAITPLPDPTVIGATIHKTTSNTYGHCLLNADHPFVKWLVLARGACERGQHRLSPEQFSRVMSLLADPLSYHGFHVESLIKYLDGWRSLAELPPELYPPDTELTAAMFTLSPPRPPGT